MYIPTGIHKYPPVGDNIYAPHRVRDCLPGANKKRSVVAFPYVQNTYEIQCYRHWDHDITAYGSRFVCCAALFGNDIL